MHYLSNSIRKYMLFLMIVSAGIFIFQSTGFAQEITPIVQDDEEFRFSVMDDAKLVLLRKGSVIKEEKDDSSRDVAISKEISKAYILSDEEEDNWKYIESGDARGFIRETEFIDETISEKITNGISEDEMSTASLLVSPSNNKAIDYTNVTAEDNVVDGVKMKTAAEIEVKERQNKDSVTVGIMSVGSVCYVLEDPGTGWVYIESGDVRGFVETKALLKDASFDSKDESVAIETIPPSQNTALRYSKKSIRAANDIGKVRQNIIEFAKSFVGNPYVWGGESLTNGADCSGFVKSIYSYYGVSLPRVACDQAQTGKRISVSEAQPGDLVFYADGSGYVYHVAMYIGDGMIVHAANSREGIKIGNVGSACWAVDLLSA